MGYRDAVFWVAGTAGALMGIFGYELAMFGLTIIAVYAGLPYGAEMLGKVLYRLFVETPDDVVFETSDDAELWLLERGYQIEHKCPVHAVGRKQLWIPGLTARTVISVYPSEEELEEFDREHFQ